MARNLKPVSIAGIEGDALISEDISYSADIPEYPVENGYNVSDTVLSEFSYDVLEKFNVGIIERRCYKFDSVFIKRLDCIIVSYWCNR